ncbi:MAG: S8 family serine peptidase [Vicinamibacterales bacterium]
MAVSRFVVLPGDNRFNFRMHSRSLDLFSGGGMAMAGGGGGGGIPPGLLGRVLGRIGVPEALLVALDDKNRLAFQRQYPGLRVVEEGTAQMAMMTRQLLPIDTGGMATAGARKLFTVKVIDPAGKALKKVRVTVLTDLATDPPTGAEVVADAKGIARFPLPSRTKIVRVLAEQDRGYWASSWKNSSSRHPASVTLVCRPIDPAVPDGLRRLHPSGTPTDGAGVTVAVIDGGASHPSLNVAEGVNLTEGESETNWADNGIGHGTHVAGIIAAQPGDHRPAGLAPGVRLLVYRVYAKGSTRTGSFAVSRAIRRAVDEGADLINLSLTLDGDVSLTEREIKRARAQGALCVAAAGNTADAVRFPARFPSVAAVAAIGVRDGWPKEAHEFDMRSSPKAKGHRTLGVAAFSCHGPEVDFAAPGVGVVSLMPKNAIGSMNGTSMAAPAVTGLVARKLGANPDVLGADRDQARSDAILTLAMEVARSIGLPSKYEGHGVLSG